MAYNHAPPGQHGQPNRRPTQDPANALAQPAVTTAPAADGHSVISASANIIPVKAAREQLHVHGGASAPLADRIH